MHEEMTVEKVLKHFDASPPWIKDFWTYTSRKMERLEQDRDELRRELAKVETYRVKADMHLDKIKYDANERLEFARAILDDQRTIITRLTQERDAARAVLQQVEWEGDPSGWKSCPMCANREPTGHAADCALAANLPPEPEAPSCV